jgi:8-oxo-dGTP pyrophosphatase MutT (NUDIX family)
MPKTYWKKISTTTLLSHPRINIVEDEVLLPTGTQTKYIRFENLGDYVTVIAEKEGKIAMIREYSYPHDEWLWQFPEGVIESGETPEASAHRELLEEAGVQAEQLQALGMNYDHHRRSTAKDYVFVAREVTKAEKSGGDEEEHGTETHWFTLSEIEEMLRGGHIVQKNAAAALALYFIAQDR